MHTKVRMSTAAYIEKAQWSQNGQALIKGLQAEENDASVVLE